MDERRRAIQGRLEGYEICGDDTRAKRRLERVRRKHPESSGKQRTSLQ